MELGGLPRNDLDFQPGMGCLNRCQDPRHQSRDCGRDRADPQFSAAVSVVSEDFRFATSCRRLRPSSVSERPASVGITVRPDRARRRFELLLQRTDAQRHRGRSEAEAAGGFGDRSALDDDHEGPEELSIHKMENLSSEGGKGQLFPSDRRLVFWPGRITPNRSGRREARTKGLGHHRERKP